MPVEHLRDEILAVQNISRVNYRACNDDINIRTTLLPIYCCTSTLSNGLKGASLSIEDQKMF